jgi:hypothetical protein
MKCLADHHAEDGIQVRESEWEWDSQFALININKSSLGYRTYVELERKARQIN